MLQSDKTMNNSNIAKMICYVKRWKQIDVLLDKINCSDNGCRCADSQNNSLAWILINHIA